MMTPQAKKIAIDALKVQRGELVTKEEEAGSTAAKSEEAAVRYRAREAEYAERIDRVNATIREIETS